MRRFLGAFFASARNQESHCRQYLRNHVSGINFCQRQIAKTFHPCLNHLRCDLNLTAGLSRIVCHFPSAGLSGAKRLMTNRYNPWVPTSTHEPKVTDLLVGFHAMTQGTTCESRPPIGTALLHLDDGICRDP
jgi:hypothetical protein